MRGGETKRQQLQRGQQQCGHCNRTVRAMAMAAEVEAELQTAWSLMQAIVLAHAQANALTELTRIAVAIATHWPDHRHWAISKQQRRQRSLTDVQRKAVRMVCNTLCLPLHGQAAGTDPTLTPSQQRVMRTLVHRWCPGTRGTESSGDTATGSTVPPTQCLDCSYWKRQTPEDNSNLTCPSCLTHRMSPANLGHPCQLCAL